MRAWPVRRAKIRAVLAILTTGLVGVALIFASRSFAGSGTFEPHTLKVEGVERSYRIYIPDSVDGQKSAPALIAFHGFESDASGFRWFIEPDALAEKYGMLVVYPEAIAKSWNAGKGSGTRNRTTDDASFSDVLIPALLQRHPIDPRRVFVMGYSNGAQMAALTVCRNSSRLAGAAMVSHTLNIQACSPSHGLPVTMVHGAKDPFVPLAGGGKFELTSHHRSVEFFRSINAARHKEHRVVDLPNVRCTEYAANRPGLEVTSCIVFDGGHTWPGGRPLDRSVFGPVNRDLKMTEFLFARFAKIGAGLPLEARKTRAVVADVAPEKIAAENDAAPEFPGFPERGLSSSEGHRFEQGTSQRIHK